HGDQIYRVQFNREFQSKQERYGFVPMPLANYVRQNFKEVSKVVRYQTVFSDMRIGDEVFASEMIYADSDFFNLFTYDLKYGSFSNIKNKSQVLISDEAARKYFNKEDVVGNMLTQMILGKDGIRRPKEFLIGGVYKQQPFNSSFHFDVITA